MSYCLTKQIIVITANKQGKIELKSQLNNELSIKILEELIKEMRK